MDLCAYACACPYIVLVHDEVEGWVESELPWLTTYTCKVHSILPVKSTNLQTIGCSAANTLNICMNSNPSTLHSPVIPLNTYAYWYNYMVITHFKPAQYYWVLWHDVIMTLLHDTHTHACKHICAKVATSKTICANGCGMSCHLQ